MYDMLDRAHYAYGVLLNPCRAATKSVSNHACTCSKHTGERAENVPAAFGDLLRFVDSKEADCIFLKFLEF